MTDSAWAYGIGLGIVSAPVILYLMGLHQHPTRNDLPWLGVITGTVGMILAGATTYATTRRPRRSLDRALLLTLTTPLLGLLYAALPFILFYVVGFLVALAFGLFLMPWAIVVTACWSAFYFAMPAEGRVPIHVFGAIAERRSIIIRIVGAIFLLPCLATVIWLEAGSLLRNDPPRHPASPPFMRLLGTR